MTGWERSNVDWVPLALILILLAVIVLAMVLIRRAAAASQIKACPNCGQRVPVDAPACRFCGVRFENLRPPDWPGAGSG